MGKKKKTYVRPEMKIIEVKTEGVIAASGGETPIEYDDLCNNNCLSNADPTGKCTIGHNPNCQNLDLSGATTYSAFLKPNTWCNTSNVGKRIHYKVIESDKGEATKLLYWPCDCK